MVYIEVRLYQGFVCYHVYPNSLLHCVGSWSWRGEGTNPEQLLKVENCNSNSVSIFNIESFVFLKDLLFLVSPCLKEICTNSCWKTEDSWTSSLPLCSNNHAWLSLAAILHFCHRFLFLEGVLSHLRLSLQEVQSKANNTFKTGSNYFDSSKVPSLVLFLSFCGWLIQAWTWCSCCLFGVPLIPTHPPKPTHFDKGWRCVSRSSIPPTPIDRPRYLKPRETMMKTNVLHPFLSVMSSPISHFLFTQSFSSS